MALVLVARHGTGASICGLAETGGHVTRPLTLKPTIHLLIINYYQLKK